MARPFVFKSVCFDPIPVAGRVVDFFAPARATRDLALFFVHGGGWNAGTRTHFHTLLHAYTRRGFHGATTDYRLGGSTTILDQVADVRRGYELFLDELTRLGQPTRVLVIGSSAGAHLALLLSMTRPGTCGESFQPAWPWIAPVGVAVQAAPFYFEPWRDAFPPAWSAMAAVAGRPYEKNRPFFRRLSPIRRVTRSTPPIFLLHAQNEHMFPYEHVQQFARRMRAAGRRCQVRTYENCEHGFFYDLSRRQQRQAFADILDFAGTL